jgi:hypothetical protein
VWQIHGLLQRHLDISAERHQSLLKYHQKSLADASHLPEGILRQAKITLTSWGMELFESCVQDSMNMEMVLAADGKTVFRGKDKPDVVLLKFEQ